MFSKFEEQFRSAQPVWSKRIFWLIGFPAWLTFGAAIISSFDGSGLPLWGLIAFAIFAVVALMQWICFATYDHSPRNDE